MTPLAVGEVFNSIWDCKHLIEKQLIDYIRTTIVHGGGITHLRRIADYAALYHVRTGCHGATDLSPVCMGAALHFDTWVPNFGIQEFMQHTPETLAVFPNDYAFHDGRLHCGEAPGHGVAIDEELAKRYPINRSNSRSRVSKTARCGIGDLGFPRFVFRPSPTPSPPRLCGISEARKGLKGLLPPRISAQHVV